MHEKDRDPSWENERDLILIGRTQPGELLKSRSGDLHEGLLEVGWSRAGYRAGAGEISTLIIALPTSGEASRRIESNSEKWLAFVSSARYFLE